MTAKRPNSARNLDNAIRRDGLAKNGALCIEHTDHIASVSEVFELAS